jgi:DNA-binding MarR family transcriptional regulator
VVIAKRRPASSGSGYVLDDQIGFLLRQVTQRHTTIFSHLMGDGLTPMQWAVLAKLLEIGSTSQTALGRAVTMDAATVKGTVDRLVARNLVVRLQDAEDRRKLLVDLTEEGREIWMRRAPSPARPWPRWTTTKPCDSSRFWRRCDSRHSLTQPLTRPYISIFIEIWRNQTP